MAEIGDVIREKYEVLDLLGRGGMSSVYLVMDLKLQKKWAVKEITKLHHDKVEQLYADSVMAEIKVMKKLDHPALPRIVDVVEEKNDIYVVMDYIEGSNLAGLLQKEGTIQQEKVLKWAKELCSVFAYLHGQKPPIIYRDMKPSNIIITRNGDVKLIDFGSAREYKEQNEEDTHCLGTRGYAAPEQFGGKGQSDVRTDIYSLGITLYQLLTGERPWENYGELLLDGRRKCKLTDGWEYIIRKCIWRNPNLRYQSCQELVRDLNNYEKLDKKYRRKKQWKERLIRVTKKVAVVLLAVIAFLVIKNHVEIELPELEEWESCYEIIKKAEKLEFFSAFKNRLDSFLQKIYQFLNL